MLLVAPVIGRPVDQEPVLLARRGVRRGDRAAGAALLVDLAGVEDGGAVAVDEVDGALDVGAGDVRPGAVVDQQSVLISGDADILEDRFVAVEGERECLRLAVGLVVVVAERQVARLELFGLHEDRGGAGGAGGRRGLVVDDHRVRRARAEALEGDVRLVGRDDHVLAVGAGLDGDGHAAGVVRGDGVHGRLDGLVLAGAVGRDRQRGGRLGRERGDAEGCGRQGNQGGQAEGHSS